MEIPDQNSNPKIAIIGSGVCGASSANYLASLFPDASIKIFERSCHVGGRAVDFEYRGLHAELGAGFFIEANKCVVEFAAKFGLERKLSLKDKRSFICWDGERVIYNSSCRFNRLRMIYNYGWSLFKLRQYLGRTLKRFMACYEHIDLKNSAKKAFDSPQEFLKIVGLENEVSVSGQEHVNSIGLGNKFIHDFLYGVVCGIYNNRLKSINAAAIMVALQGMFQKAYSFAQGNNSLPREIIKDVKGLNLLLETEVSEIHFDQKRKTYKLKFQTKGEPNFQFEDFNVVIIATPLKQSGIKLTGLKKLDNVEITNLNKQVHVNLVEGKVNNQFFGLAENDKLVESPIFVEGYEKKLPGVNSFDQIHDFKDGSFLYRIESSCAISQKLLGSLFKNHKIVKTHVWDFAYPSLPPIKPAKLVKFRLNQGLYFPSAMEFVASCMEMQCIAAKNVAKMILEREGANWNKSFNSTKIKVAD